MHDAEEGYRRLREGGYAFMWEKPHSTVDEGKGDVVMLYYPLFWCMMQRRVQEVERGGIRVHVGNPIL